MDIKIDVDDYTLNIRAACTIIHDNKILLHKNVNSDHYAIIGGRVEVGEDSENIVIREIKEEIGKDIKITGYVATIENFFEMKEKQYHEILFIHKAEFIDKEDKKIVTTLRNIEGKDYLQYEWIDLNKIDKVNLLPANLKDILKEGKFPVHKINDERRKNENYIY